MEYLIAKNLLKTKNKEEDQCAHCNFIITTTIRVIEIINIVWVQTNFYIDLSF